MDLLTVYRDRRAFPHRLASAIEAYNLQDQVQNSHRAIDDVLATVAVLEAMAAERGDLTHYINLFGYNPFPPSPTVPRATSRAGPCMSRWF